MDEKSRVKNIKEKFEVLNISTNSFAVGRKFDVPNDAPINKNNSGSNSDSTSNIIEPTSCRLQRSNIKRTPAFRREKSLQKIEIKDSLLKSGSLVDNRVKQFSDPNFKSNDEVVPYKKNIVQKEQNHILEQTNTSHFNFVPKENVIKNEKNVSKTKNVCHKTIVLDRDEVLKLNARKKNDFNIETHASSDIQHSSYTETSVNSGIFMSDTLKRVLQSPLPTGPPPKKPPRIFIANKDCRMGRKDLSFSSENDAKGATDIVKCANGKNNRQLLSKPVRSKSELELMLKKIENASVKHQQILLPSVQKDCKNIKPVIEEVYDKSSVSCFNILQLKTCTSAESIYAEPLPPQSTFFIEIETDEKLGASGTHIYDEIEKDVESSKCKTLSQLVTSSQGSLYYMSTPIDSLISSVIDHKAVLRPPLLTNVKMSEVSRTFQKPNEIGSIHSEKVRVWINEAYSRPWSNMSDDGSDVDSTTSSEDSALDGHMPHIISDNFQEQVVKKRKGYVQRVATRALSQDRSMCFTSSVHPGSTKNNTKHVFECLILVGLDMGSSSEKIPYIKMKYPLETMVPMGVENFCFPDANNWPIATPGHQIDKKIKDDSDHTDKHCYTIILTDKDGKRKYAYCRRVLPEGATKPLPLAYCILSPHRASHFYFSVLNELESRHGQADQLKFIESLYLNDFPVKGHTIQIPYSGDPAKTITFKRELDSRMEDVELAKSLTYLKTNLFLQMYSTLLIERSLILTSTSINKLSVCIDGLQMALQPFKWQHVLISVVPSSVISVSDLCQAPTPYCIGLLKPNMKHDITLSLPPLDSLYEVVVVDLDECKMIHRVGDEDSILPYRLLKGLGKALQNAKIQSSDISLHNVLACEAFMRLFVEIIGHYRHYIITSEHARRKLFQKEAFIRGALSKSIRLFLEWFAETSMFTEFIESRLYPSPESRGIFEQRCNEFNEEIERLKCLKNETKDSGKTVIRQIGDRIRDWTSG